MRNEKKKQLVKKVSFYFISEGRIGYMYVDAECNSIEDVKEALEFAEKASKLVPTIPIKTNNKLSET